MAGMNDLRQAQADEAFQSSQVAAGQRYRQNILNHDLEMSPYQRSAANGADPATAQRNLGEAREAGQRGSYFGALGGSTTALVPGQLAESLARANLTNASNPNNNLIDAGNYNAFNAGVGSVPGEYKKGKTRVPGHGDGTEDTVPSMLAPGEAVLNKEAADHLGRGTINILNAIGLAKRQVAGVGAAQDQGTGEAAGNQEPSGNVPGYASGTDYTDRINGMPGSPNSGYWGPNGDTPLAPNSGQNLRASLGIQGAQRPAPGSQPARPPVKGPLGFNEGTSKVSPAKKGKVEGDDAARGQNGPTDHRTQGATQGFNKGGHAQAPKGKEKGNGAEPNKGKMPPAHAAPPAHDHVHPDGHVTIHPGVLQALLAGAGGGMPTPGTTQPMPMPMPMAAGVGQTPPQMGGNSTRLPMQGGGQ